MKAIIKRSGAPMQMRVDDDAIGDDNDDVFENDEPGKDIDDDEYDDSSTSDRPHKMFRSTGEVESERSNSSTTVFVGGVPLSATRGALREY
jgi:hypothetical protein